MLAVRSKIGDVLRVEPGRSNVVSLSPSHQEVEDVTKRKDRERLCSQPT